MSLRRPSLASFVSVVFGAGGVLGTAGLGADGGVMDTVFFASEGLNPIVTRTGVNLRNVAARVSVTDATPAAPAASVTLPRGLPDRDAAHARADATPRVDRRTVPTGSDVHRR